MQTESRQSGFSLVELLIALAIFAVISAASFVALSSAVRSYSFLSGISEEQSKAEIFIALITRDFLQIVPRAVRDANGDYQPAFATGGDYAVAFSRSGMPRLGNNTGLGRVAYVLEKKQIWRYSWPYLDNIRTTEPGRALLLDKVKKFDIVAIDEDLNDVREWPRSSGEDIEVLLSLPQAVQVSVEVEDMGELVRFIPGVSSVYRVKNKDQNNPEKIGSQGTGDRTTDVPGG